MTKKEIDIIKHSLGLNYNKVPFRNHFVTGPGSSDYEAIEDLVKQGYMVKRKSGILPETEFVYHVTDAGKEAIKNLMQKGKNTK